jgi:glycosyltransferase involved in cell wall biosynthesis
LTVSRLDRPKRVDLLIKAMRHVRADVRLLVAGTGPEQPRLLRLAAKDARVEFLGFVPDEQLVDLYAQAIAVPFVPLDEDFGLVTLEAGMAGKPVITALDSGGPRELVANGNNGLVVEPTPRAIGRAMTRLVEDPARAQELGLAAQRTANSVTWDTVLEQVLGEADRPALPPITRRPPRRSLAPRLVVVSTFPVHPRRGGGQLRAFHLYGRLAPAYDVEILSLTSPGASSPGWRSLGPGCRELVVEKTPEHLEGEAAASVAAGFPADDIVAARLVPLTPAFERALERSLEGASGVILCHPFLAEVAHRLRPDLPMIYDAHNAEIALKGQLLGGRPEAAHLVDEVRTSEALACHQSAFIAVASPDDVATLSREYGVRPEKMILVPNGVDTQAKAFVTSQERKANKASWRAAYPALAGMGVPDHLALFVASWHPPNIQAAKAIVAMAPELPEAQFLLVGSHADALDPNDLPGNVTQMGPVSEATLSRLLATADVGLNPMLSGGGSNLKMFEYLAVGLPVVTTAVGARGLAGGGERAFSVETIERFPSAISALLEHAQGAGRQARAGRKLVETVYDWEVLAGSLRQRIRTLVRGVPFGQPPAGILSASR